MTVLALRVLLLKKQLACFSPMDNSTARFILFPPLSFHINPSSDSAYDTPARLYAQMAEFDKLTNQTKYKQTLKQCFALAESTSPEFLNKMSVHSHNTFWIAAERP